MAVNRIDVLRCLSDAATWLDFSAHFVYGVNAQVDRGFDCTQSFLWEAFGVSGGLLQDLPTTSNVFIG